MKKIMTYGDGEEIEVATCPCCKVDRDQFSVVKGTVKVHFKPISRDGKTRRWWEAKRTIENMHEVPPAKDQFGKKHKSVFIHAFMILEMEEQDK